MLSCEIRGRGIEGAVSAAFEIGSKDAGPGIGENAERIDAEEDGERGEFEEELSFVFQYGAHIRHPSLRRSENRKSLPRRHE